MEQQINKLRYFSFAVLSIAIAITVIVLFFANTATAIILLVLVWLSAAIIMSWFGYKIRNLRNEQMMAQQIYVAPPTYPQQIYHDSSTPPVYSTQPVYSTPPVYHEPIQPVYQKN